ncbi:OsmC family protein [Sphingobacterium hungaricum]
MDNEVKVSIAKDKYKTEVTYGKHLIIADEPTDVGGTDLGMPPTSLFLSSLGTCKVMTMRMYADRKGWDLQTAQIRLSSEVVKSEQQQTTYIKCHITITGDLDDEQRQRIYKIADRCPIQKIISNPIVIESNLLSN